MAGCPEARPALAVKLSILTPGGHRARPLRLGGTERWRGCAAGTGWELDMQGGSVAARAEDRECPAEGLDPVVEADDAGAAAGVGAADAVVMDPKGEGAVAAIHPDVDDRHLRVLLPRW